MNRVYEEMNPYVIFCKAVRRENCPPAGMKYKKRRVRWYELEFIVDGNGFIETNGVRLPTEPGTLFFRRPGDVVQGILPYYGYLIIFDMFWSKGKEKAYGDIDIKGYNTFIQGGTTDGEEDPSDFGLPPRITGLKLADYEKLFEALFHQFSVSGKEDQIFLKTTLYNIVVKALHDCEALRFVQNSSRSAQRNYKKVLKVKNYILDNVSMRFSLVDLARVSDLSPNFLSKIFKMVMGVKLFDYINLQKLNLAKKLLIGTDRPVKSVCSDCGFENESYFYRTFKKSVGKSPQKFREEYERIDREFILDQISNE